MNDVISFETARRLKEAGFPQPEPKFGQAWYSAERVGVVSKTLSTPEGMWAWLFAPDGSWAFGRAENGVYFAPTATDILHEIHLFFPASAGGSYYWMMISPRQNLWEVAVKIGSVRDVASFSHQNPAEAAALAYEWVKNQKNV